MDRQEIRSRARFLYTDELQYALRREESGFDTDPLREQAAGRLASTREKAR